MKNRLTRDQLRHFAQSDNQPYLVNTLNAMIDLCRANGIPVGSGWNTFQEGSFEFPAVRSRRPADWVQVSSSIDNVDPFGIVEVYGGAFSDVTREITVTVRKATTTTPGLLYAGNEDYALHAGLPGWVRVINPYAPVVVRTGPTDSPSSATFWDRVGVDNVGDDFVSSIADGYLRAVSASQPSTGYVPVIRDLIMGPMVGKSTAAVNKGALGNVEVWSLPSGTTLSSASSLTDSGVSTMALFLFGSCPGADKWIELTPHYFGLVATVMDC